MEACQAPDWKSAKFSYCIWNFQLFAACIPHWHVVLIICLQAYFILWLWWFWELWKLYQDVLSHLKMPVFVFRACLIPKAASAPLKNIYTSVFSCKYSKVHLWDEVKRLEGKLKSHLQVWIFFRSACGVYEYGFHTAKQ